jgi:hypothetical protein
MDTPYNVGLKFKAKPANPKFKQFFKNKKLPVSLFEWSDNPSTILSFIPAYYIVVIFDTLILPNPIFSHNYKPTKNFEEKWR